MGAANIFTIGMGVAQYQAQGKIGKFSIRKPSSSVRAKSRI